MIASSGFMEAMGFRRWRDRPDLRRKRRRWLAQYVRNDVSVGPMKAKPKNGASGGSYVLDDLGNTPGHLMRRCQQIAVSVFLDECRVYELTPLQFAVLAALLKGGPEDQVRLGGSLALDRTTISVVVKKLEGRGLVQRRASEKDRRSKLIYITSAGEDLVSHVLPAVEAAQDRMMSPLSASERRRFVGLLRKMADGNNEESRAPLRR